MPFSAPGGILLAWRRSELELVVCPALLSELGAVLARPKLRGRTGQDEADRLVGLLRAQAELRADPQIESSMARDPKDDYMVALARATRADLIVSGDDDLATARNMTPPVLRPAELLDRLRRNVPD